MNSRIAIKLLAVFAAFFLTAAKVSATYYPVTAFLDTTISKSYGNSFDGYVEAWNSAGGESCVVNVYLIVKNESGVTIAEFEALMNVDSGGGIWVTTEDTGFSHTTYFNPGLYTEANLSIMYTPPEGVTNYTVEMIVTPEMDPEHSGGYIYAG